MAPFEKIGWPVRTTRLTLRPATADDVPATWAYRRLEEVGRWITRAPTSEAEYGAEFAMPEVLARTLVLERDGVVIGDLMVKVQDAWTQAEVSGQGRGVEAELGWTLDPAHGGRGYATEAVGELIRLCFAELGLRRVTAGCFADNEPSWRLMERVGMRRESHTVRDALHRSGRWLDGMSYALLAEEWAAASS